MIRGNAPFKCYVDSQGFYTTEYKDWCVKTENYPGSGLMIDDVSSDAGIKKIGDVEYVETYPDKSKELAQRWVKQIREYGGLAVIRTCMRKKQKMYVVWFNPNGSHKAREYVAGW
jgi:hypothetical protein